MKFSIDRYFGSFICINNRFYYNFSTDRWLDTKERYHTEVGFKSLIEKLMNIMALIKTEKIFEEIVTKIQKNI
jgi:hypothetical protein